MSAILAAWPRGDNFRQRARVQRRHLHACTVFPTALTAGRHGLAGPSKAGLPKNNQGVVNSSEVTADPTKIMLTEDS